MSPTQSTHSLSRYILFDVSCLGSLLWYMSSFAPSRAPPISPIVVQFALYFMFHGKIITTFSFICWIACSNVGTGSGAGRTCPPSPLRTLRSAQVMSPVAVLVSVPLPKFGRAQRKRSKCPYYLFFSFSGH